MGSEGPSELFFLVHVLIDGQPKRGNFDRAFELMSKMMHGSFLEQRHDRVFLPCREPLVNHLFPILTNDGMISYDLECNSSITPIEPE